MKMSEREEAAYPSFLTWVVDKNKRPFNYIEYQLHRLDILQSEHTLTRVIPKYVTDLICVPSNGNQIVTLVYD